MNSNALASRVSNVAARLENDGDEWGVVALLREAAAALSAGAEPVGHVLTRDLLSVEAGDTGTLWPSPSESLDTISGRRDQTVPLYTRPQPASGEVRLFDSQWVNILNHDNCWRHYEILDAVAQAVRMTEAAIAKNVADGKLPQPRPPASTETDKQTAAEQAALERV